MARVCRACCCVDCRSVAAVARVLRHAGVSADHCFPRAAQARSPAMASAAAQRVYAASEDLREDRITEEQLVDVARVAARDMDERTITVVSDLLHRR